MKLLDIPLEGFEIIYLNKYRISPYYTHIMYKGNEIHTNQDDIENLLKKLKETFKKAKNRVLN